MIYLVKYFLAVFQLEQIKLFVDSTFIILYLYASLSDWCIIKMKAKKMTPLGNTWIVCIRKTKIFSLVNLFHCHSEKAVVTITPLKLYYYYITGYRCNFW